MPHFIKTGYWDCLSTAPKNYLNLDKVICSIAGSGGGGLIVCGDAAYTAKRNCANNVANCYMSNAFGLNNVSCKTMSDIHGGLMNTIGDGLFSISCTGSNGYFNPVGELTLNAYGDYTSYFSAGSTISGAYLGIACCNGMYQKFFYDVPVTGSSYSAPYTTICVNPSNIPDTSLCYNFVKTSPLTSSTYSSTYASCAPNAIVGGIMNTISYYYGNGYSFIGIGFGNTVSGGYGTILNGTFNTTSYGGTVLSGNLHCASSGGLVGGGFYNRAFGGTVIGGLYNCADNGSFVGGGCFNRSYNSSFIGGGVCNYATAQSTVMGGQLNTACSNYSFIGAGCSNTISGYYQNNVIVTGAANCIEFSSNSMIATGVVNNICTSTQSVILTGNLSNIHNSPYSSMLGGSIHYICNSNGSVVAGGTINRICCATFSSILGGACNCALHEYSFITGCAINSSMACALHANRLVLTNLPTSAAGLPAGAIWKDTGAGNVLKIV